MLHNDKDLFEKIVLDTSNSFGIVPVIIEKDYYVTLFLREIVKRFPKIIFKGGTSLSKCYHLINRFSEDIDLNIEGANRPTEGQRKKLVTTIKDIIEYFEFDLKNPDDIRSRRDFNRFEVDVHSLFSSDYLKHDLIVETAVFMRSYPSVEMGVSSFVSEYLKSIEREDIIRQYGMESFIIQVQAVERTFIDKLFAICDYYLAGKIDEHSRHLYDLYKMSSVVINDKKLRSLYLKVRDEREGHSTCLSAQDNVDVRECLQEIIEKDVYKKDYENITAPLLFDKVDYGMVKANLTKILSSDLLI